MRTCVRPCVGVRLPPACRDRKSGLPSSKKQCKRYYGNVTQRRNNDIIAVRETAGPLRIREAHSKRNSGDFSSTCPSFSGDFRLSNTTRRGVKGKREKAVEDSGWGGVALTSVRSSYLQHTYTRTVSFRFISSPLVSFRSSRASGDWSDLLEAQV